MRSFYTLSLVLVLFALFFYPTRTHSYRHQSPARHRRVTFEQKHKRDDDVAFTYFNDGQGACGAENSPGDFIVAVNSADFAGGAHCFETITITIDGKTAQAVIVDKCVGCTFGGLDLSEGLFQYFAVLSTGVLYGSWTYSSDITSSSTSSLTTSTESPTTSSTSSFAPTTTTSSSSTTTSLSSIPVPSSTSATSTAPTSTAPTPQESQVITQANLALLEIGSLLVASREL